MSGRPSNGNTVFDYETGYAYCPVCHERLMIGWHTHRTGKFGLRTRNWWIQRREDRIDVRAWRIGPWLRYHLKTDNPVLFHLFDDEQEEGAS